MPHLERYTILFQDDKSGYHLGQPASWQEEPGALLCTLRRVLGKDYLLILRKPASNQAVYCSW